MNKRWLSVIVPTVLAGSLLAGCGAVSAQAASGSSKQAMGNTTNTSMSNAAGGMSNAANSKGNSSGMTGNAVGSMGSSTGLMKGTVSAGMPLQIGDLLVGPSASPMMGSGSGGFFIDNVTKAMVTNVPLSTGANSLQAAISGHTAYVPTLQGETFVVNLNTRMVTGHFMTPQNARIASIADGGKLLLLTGASSVTAYSLPSHTMQWQVKQGGNTLAVAGGAAYLSGNGAADTAVINLKTGQQMGTIPVGQVENSVYDPQRHTLWLANWTTGAMTVVNTKDNKVVATIHETQGGGFSPSNMMGSTGGFMQLAVGPRGKTVYAASFSGDIMAYNAVTNMFEKNIPVGSGSKLSGLAIDSSGRYAYVTVENKKETVAVSLATGQVVSTMHGVQANRWAVVD
ncbi:YncE family protein [Alicyclobacillus sp. ALC3]|uniref:YncE family protein n=1 Tax=Alicyclobacillus sp. ALC3 TaxID=2796143 RepID=UPI00237905A9|nr:hypothetical protein [Alicyclobacillus sp. ALC3]WDL99103.1 hypothetical protein JC200_10895 [Alicyclobacillus sp. ALC3]